MSALSILVVDDNERFRTALGIVLEANLFRVTLAASHHEALARLKTEFFSLVLTDYVLDALGEPDRVARFALSRRHHLQSAARRASKRAHPGKTLVSNLHGGDVPVVSQCKIRDTRALVPSQRCRRALPVSVGLGFRCAASASRRGPVSVRR